MAEKPIKSELSKLQSKRFIKNLIVITFLVTVAGAVMEFFKLPYMFYVIVIGLMPAIVANIIDTRPGRFASKTITAFNLAGISPHLAGMAVAGSPEQTAFTILNNPTAWLLIYGFAAFGWSVIYIIPQMTHLYLDIRASFFIKKFEGFQDKLVEEWGEGIKYASGKAPPKKDPKEKLEDKPDIT